MKILKTFLIIAFLTVTASAQVAVTQETAEKCAKCFTTSAAQESVIAAQTAEINALKREVKATEAQTEAQRAISKLLTGQVEIYRKMKCSQLSFLFGLIKKKSCF